MRHTVCEEAPPPQAYTKMRRPINIAFISCLMSTSDASEDANTVSPPRSRLVLYSRSLNQVFSARFSDSNATTSFLPGPGYVLGRLFSAGGRRLETVVDRTAARVGLGFEGIARRLLMKLRARHSRCQPWPDFAKTPVVELAVELGNSCCGRCEDRYTSFLDSKGDTEIEDLLRRLISSIE
jgi:hypothetical protein